MRHVGKSGFRARHPAVSGSISLESRHTVRAPIEDAPNAEMAHLHITIHVEPPDKAKPHGVPEV